MLAHNCHCRLIPGIPQSIKVDKSHIHECMIEMLSDMFGKECIGKMIRGNNISVTVEDKLALVNVETLVCKLFTHLAIDQMIKPLCEQYRRESSQK